MTNSITHSQAAAFRMARHHLIGSRSADLRSICSHVCGIQAQVNSAAELAFWARNPGIAPGQVHGALRSVPALVKTSLMRQTLHIIPATEFSIYISALKNSRRAAILRGMARCGAASTDADDLNNAVVRELRDGPLTQSEIRKRIEAKAGKNLKTWMKRFFSVCRPAVVEGLICYAAEKAGEITYARVDQWLPKHREVEPGEAQQFLVRNYLRAYGPARLQDFSKWSGITMKEARPVWDSLADEMAEVSIEGERNWILRKELDRLKDADLSKPVLRLLGAFDPYLLAHVKKTHLVGEKHYKKIYREAGWITPVVLVNGRVAGI